MTETRRGDAGLSLVEVLVSLAIFAIIGVAGLSILNTVARTGERTETRLERLAEIDRAFLVIRRDLAQMAFTGVTLGSGILGFRRAGTDSAVNLAYSIDDAVLMRRVDQPGMESVAQTLLPGTVTAQWRLLDSARIWHDQWPPAGSNSVGRPLAAELRLELWLAGADTPSVATRLIALPAGQGR